MDNSILKDIIDYAWINQDNLYKLENFKDICNAVFCSIKLLNDGKERIAKKKDKKWIINLWLKKAILLYFKLKNNLLISSGYTKFFDKIPLRFESYKYNNFCEERLRIVPPAVVRYGSYIAKNTVLMPSYVNIGAYIDEGSMIDTWATIGSCAQIGKNVHISGGVGIGGVLEPLQSSPVIIEDNCFIGARSEITEGVIIKNNSVISMGVYLSKSTKIYDRNKKTIIYGHIPSFSVVVPGSLPSIDKSHNIYCAIIVKKVDKKTLSKISINDLLRDYKNI